MKREKIIQLALAGLANGLLLNAAALAASDSQQQSNQTLSSPKGMHGSLYAAKCGASGCSSVATRDMPEGGPQLQDPSKADQSSKGAAVDKGCAAVAAKCGASGCSSIAARDLPEGGPKLQDPSKADPSSKGPASDYDPNSENLSYHLMSEDELLMELNDDSIKQYRALSPEGKELARALASKSCEHTNDCRGLNACESPSNACAGKGSCKGTGKCALSDKNLAVRIVADKMAQKRSQSLSNSR
jgi:hypothetical protein